MNNWNNKPHSSTTNAEAIKQHKLTWVQAKLLPHAENKSNHIDIKAFDIVLIDSEGNEQVVDYTFLLGYPRNQDVIDSLMYFEKNGEYRIVINKSIRPVIIGRSLLTNDQACYTQGDLFTELPAVIFDDLKGDTSPKETMLRWLEEKHAMEASSVIKFQLVGGCLYPSIGGDCEMDKVFHVQLNPGGQFDSDYIVYWKDFGGNRVVSSMTPQEIIDGFCKGEIFDMRLLYATLQFAHQRNIKLDLPLWLKANKLTEYNITMPNGRQVWNTITVANRKEIVSAHKQASNIADIKLRQKSFDPQKDRFVHESTFELTNTYDDGATETYRAEWLVRQTPDSIDVGGYFFSGGKLYMTCRLAVRPGILARNFKPHPIASSVDPVHIEWISGLGNRSVEDIIYSESGCQTGNAQHIFSYFPSTGHSPEKVDLYMAEFDPSAQVPIAKEFGCIEAKLYCVEVDEMIDMGRQGIIDDPRLLIQAYILKNTFNYNNLDKESLEDEDREMVNDILTAPSQMDMYMKETDAKYPGDDIFKNHIFAKQNSARYRKVLSYGEDCLGTKFVWKWGLKWSRVAEFFDAMLALFPVPSEELRKKYSGYAIHDAGHHIQGNILPYNPATGERMTKEEYVRLLSKTEALAVFDSDYRYAMELGIEKSEENIGWHKSIARTFMELDINDPHEVRDMIVSIEVDGVIPDKLMRHPRYEENKDNIEGRLLRFHFMDKIQAEALYDSWRENEEVIKVALRLCHTTADPIEFESRMDNYEDIVAHFPEGSNPLKAYASRIVTEHVGLTGLKYWVLNQLIKNTHGEGKAELLRTNDIINELEFYKKQLYALRDGLTDTSLSDENIKAIKRANNWKKKIIALDDEFYKIVRTKGLLNDEQVVSLTTDDIPYFHGFAQMPDLVPLIAQKAEENREKLKI